MYIVYIFVGKSVNTKSFVQYIQIQDGKNEKEG